MGSPERLSRGRTDVQTEVQHPSSTSMNSIRITKSVIGAMVLGINRQMSLRTAPGFTEKAVALEPEAANLLRSS